MPIAGQIVDFYDDVKHETFAKIAQENGISSYADTHLLDPEELRSLPDDQFGLIVLTKHAHILRKFPLSDSGNTWLSSQYFEKNHEKLSSIEKIVAATNIKQACYAYGIDASQAVDRFGLDEKVHNLVAEGARSSSIDEMLRKQAEQELTKTASAEINARMELPDSCYALVLDNDGEVVRKYAMPDSDHVKIASAYFDKYAMDLHPSHRHQFAASVLRRAEELGVELSKTAHLQKWASENYNENINWHLESRKSLLPRNTDSHAVLDKLASLRPETDPATFAEALYKFDQSTDLTKYYDKGLSDPWQSTMGIEKDASWHAEVDGDVLTSEELNKAASSDKIRSHFGSTFQDQFKKHAVQIFESLPKPERVIIKQIAKGEI